MTVAAAPACLDDVRAQAHRVYPTDLLADVRSAAMLFCAGFHGASDVVHVHDNAPLERAIGFDLDAEKILEMRGLYGWPWRFACFDAFRLKGLRECELVGLDPPIDLCGRAADDRRWYSMATRLVVHGMLVDQAREPRFRVGGVPAPGWTVVRVMPRNALAYWVVSVR